MAAGSCRRLLRRPALSGYSVQDGSFGDGFYSGVRAVSDNEVFPVPEAWAKNALMNAAAYDAAVSGWMAGAIGEPVPRHRAFAGKLAQP